jgi:hypothetical protein
MPYNPERRHACRDDALRRSPYDPEKHHRRSIRLKGYDYTQPGAYFVILSYE